MEVSLLLAVCSGVDFKPMSPFVDSIYLGLFSSAEFSWHGLWSDLHE